MKGQCKVLPAVALLALLGSIVSAGPVADVMVASDVFTNEDSPFVLYVQSIS